MSQSRVVSKRLFWFDNYQPDAAIDRSLMHSWTGRYHMGGALHFLHIVIRLLHLHLRLGRYYLNLQNEVDQVVVMVVVWPRWRILSCLCISSSSCSPSAPSSSRFASALAKVRTSSTREMVIRSIVAHALYSGPVDSGSSSRPQLHPLLPHDAQRLQFNVYSKSKQLIILFLRLDFFSSKAVSRYLWLLDPTSQRPTKASYYITMDRNIMLHLFSWFRGPSPSTPYSLTTQVHTMLLSWIFQSRKAIKRWNFFDLPGTAQPTIDPIFFWKSTSGATRGWIGMA